MNLKSILEYQKKDNEIIKLERTLENSDAKKSYLKIVDFVKQSQIKSEQLEKISGDLVDEYTKLKNTYDENLKKGAMVLNKNLTSAQQEDLVQLENASAVIMKNLQIIEKKMLAIAERVNVVLKQFEETKKIYDNAKAEHAKCKENYEKEVEQNTPSITKLKAELETLKGNIDKQLLDLYNKRRADKIVPVFVPLTDKCCGGCRMELSSQALNKLKTENLYPCENCRRIIFCEN